MPSSYKGEYPNQRWGCHDCWRLKGAFTQSAEDGRLRGGATTTATVLNYELVACVASSAPALPYGPGRTGIALQPVPFIK